MRVDEVHIPEPCHEDWDAMDPGQRGRFCRSCRKNVHDLSSMTEREARELLERGDDICVAFFEDQGRIALRPEPIVPVSQLARRRAAVPAVAGLAWALAACAPHGEAPRGTTQDALEVTLPLRPVIPEAPALSESPHDEDETAHAPAPDGVEPCSSTPDPAEETIRHPIKGKIRPRMGRPRLRPRTTPELLVE